MVPCGKCPSCLANQRQEWIFRLKQEFLASEFALFVTLTYDEEHIPLDFSVNKKDVQNFHKRLRKHFPPGDLRFYLVSEYGDHTHRPHYHGLYFFKSKYDLDHVYEVFLSSWKNGFLKFGNVEEGSIVYCTKYCMKGSATPAGCTPPFRLVSKMNGGLGSYYLEKMSSYHLESGNFDFVSSNGQRSRFPRYLKDKLLQGIKNPYLSERLEEERLQQMRDTSAKRFKDFCDTHKGLSFAEACEAFQKKEKDLIRRSEDLVKNHVKKQTF